MPPLKKVFGSLVLAGFCAVLMLVALPCNAAVGPHPSLPIKIEAGLSDSLASPAALIVGKVPGKEPVVAWGFKKKQQESSSQRANRYRNMGAKTKTYVNKAKAGMKKGAEKAKQYYQKKKVDLKHFKEGYSR